MRWEGIAAKVAEHKCSSVSKHTETVRHRDSPPNDAAAGIVTLVAPALALIRVCVCVRIECTQVFSLHEDERRYMQICNVHFAQDVASSTKLHDICRGLCETCI